MLITKVKHADLINLEPTLTDYLRSDEVDLGQKIIEAKEELQIKIKNSGMMLRKLCTPLDLTDATLSDEDVIERTRLVIDTSAVTDEATFTLEGSADDGDNYTTIKNDIIVTEIGEYTCTFEDTYKKYRLTKSGTITFTAYLVETTWELPHKYLTLSIIYKALEALKGDFYMDKRLYYEAKFESAFKNATYSYDETDDNEIGRGEMDVQHRVYFTR